MIAPTHWCFKFWRIAVGKFNTDDLFGLLGWIAVYRGYRAWHLRIWKYCLVFKAGEELPEHGFTWFWPRNCRL